jgi:hypothetical protein
MSQTIVNIVYAEISHNCNVMCINSLFNVLE